ncbi:unnamed protein product, partial [Mesorhabditis belari]|uniref:Uncharacterized protein n=1 Tax=Mesorhabditis belari TaxID=2138241 RepID=A0AAF3F8N8_9BILA
MYWQDEFLQWDPDAYEGAKEIFLASSDIWVPEFSLYYSHNFNDAVKLRSDNDIRVNNTGHIRYYIPFSTESLCELDVKFFPFDIQKCTLLFGSWAYSNDSIKYALYSDSLFLVDFYDNQEWQLDVEHSTIKSDGFLYDYLDPPLHWEMIIMELVVHRQSFYYVFNLVIPSTIITIVAVIGFHTPSTSGRLRDAKFRLGIMTLMSMSVILLAIVEDMPKFSMGRNRKGKGSPSGIPLIGLYYFILLAIIGLSTVTTSMFVFMEREIRKTHVMPWYFHWVTWDVELKLRRAAGHRKNSQKRYESMRNADPQSTTSLLPNGHLASGVRQKARGVANSLLQILHHRNNPQQHHDSKRRQKDVDEEADAQDQRLISHQLEMEESQQPTPLRHEIRRRLSIGQYDNMIVYQYFEQTLEDLIQSIGEIGKSVANIRNEMNIALPKDDATSQWQLAIRRLEILSLLCYLAVLFITMLLFFYHDWYCTIGFNPCVEMNLKCPGFKVDPSHPDCQRNSWST